MKETDMLLTRGLRRLLEHYDANEAARRNLAEVQVPKWETERDDLIARGGVEDADALKALGTLDIKLRLAPGSLKQYADRAKEIAASMESEIRRVENGVNEVRTQVESSLFERMREAIKPFISDREQCEKEARRLLVYSDAGVSLRPFTNINATCTPDAAVRLIDCAEGLARVVAKYAHLLPKGFNPFPENEGMLLRLLPERFRPGYVAPVEEAQVWDGEAGWVSKARKEELEAQKDKYFANQKRVFEEHGRQMKGQ